MFGEITFPKVQNLASEGSMFGAKRVRQRAVEECPVLMLKRIKRQVRGASPEEHKIVTGRTLRSLWLAAREEDELCWNVDAEWDGKRRPRRQALRLVATRPVIGGKRWWWECPGWPSPPDFHRDALNICRRRVERLYLRHGRWACRTCHELTYLSCRNSRRKRTWES